MTTYRLGVMHGDGIGSEIVKAALAVLDAASQRVQNTQFEWVDLPMGLAAIQSHRNPLPEHVKPELTKCHGWIMGPHDSAAYPDEFQQKRNPSGELRHHFELYANIRPAKNFPNLPSLVKNVDLVIVRENTEGFYPDRNMYFGSGEWMPTPDTAISVGVFTKKAAERIAHSAFQLAEKRRQHVTIIHKANVIKLGTGLFLKTCQKVAENYPNIEVDDYHIDAMAAHLVRRPADFDVIVTTNMFGDILSDLASELTGSLGLGASINAGTDHAMAQASHGSAPDIAGQGIANPIGIILSTVLLLEWLAEKHQDSELVALAGFIEQSISKVLSGQILTPDLGGNADTQSLTSAIIESL